MTKGREPTGSGDPYRTAPEVDRSPIILTIPEEFFSQSVRRSPLFSKAIDRGVKPEDITIQIEGHAVFKFVEIEEYSVNARCYTYRNATPLNRRLTRGKNRSWDELETLYIMMSPIFENNTAVFNFAFINPKQNND